MKSTFILNKEDFIAFAKENTQAWLETVRGTDNKNVKRVLKKIIKKVFTRSDYWKDIPLNTANIIDKNVATIKNEIIPFMEKLKEEIETSLPKITEEETKNLIASIYRNWVAEFPTEKERIIEKYFGKEGGYESYERRGGMTIMYMFSDKYESYTEKYKELIAQEIERQGTL